MPAWLSIPILIALGVHLALGLVFAIWFLARGLARLDPTAAHAPVWFRLIIAPGVVALWPVLLIRFRRPAPTGSTP